MDYKELLTRKLKLEQELDALEIQINEFRILELKNRYIGKWFKEDYDDYVYYTKITSLSAYYVPIGFGFTISSDSIGLLTDVEIDTEIAREVSEEEISKVVNDFSSRIFKRE